MNRIDRLSEKDRKQVEEVIGWMKSVGLMRKVRHRGREKVDWVFTSTAAAYNLVRLRSLVAAPLNPRKGTDPREPHRFRAVRPGVMSRAWKMLGAQGWAVDATSRTVRAPR